MNFKGTCYIIMGGTSGMGLAAAVALNEHGADLVLVGKDEESCQSARTIIGEQPIIFSGDAIEPETILKAISLAKSEFGHINGLFHVAGGSGRKFGDGPLHEMSLEGWNKTLHLNLTALMLSNKAIINYFLETGQAGTILNMGSVLAYSPSPKYFVTHAYASAKAAIIGFSKSIAAYYADKNIRVNVIAPSLFETPMAQRAMQDDTILSFVKTKQPLDGGRPGKPDDIKNAVLLFLAPDSTFITGQVLSVDGGWAISEGQYE
ncbi:SDR family NAD(P)-dependent oxidoreductase [Croceitalea sp. MTPC5]|uniref:SDR family NAD(P)-dependent oxidoreductase n=1 Tax=Croceitalea sp. MTPC5 TaxID=3056565 RepID=UPI0030CAC1EA